MEWKMRTVYVRVKCVAGQTEDVWKRVQGWKHAIGAWVVDGEWDLLVWYDASDWKESYAWSQELRSWPGVKQTSTHWVYEGGKGSQWWWNGKAGAWVWARWPGKAQDTVGKHDWIWSWASTPGEWDQIAWVDGESWEQVWDRAEALKRQGWETEVEVPLKTWWNQSWEQRWWA